MVAKKMNIASFRVLNTFVCLFHNNLSMSELIMQLNKAGYGPYNNYTVSKYIQTLKMCGIDIQKIQNRYCIINFPLGLKFSTKDAQLLYDIKLKSEKIVLSNIKYTVARFFDKVHLSFYKSGIGLVSSSNFNIIKIFELAYKTNTEIIVTDKEFNKYECFVRDIRIINGKYYFLTANKLGVKELDPDKVMNVELVNKKSKIDFRSHSVTFELMGRLAERYQLRENEKIIKFKDNGSIVVLNEYEDRHVLIQRLLRYDSCCKVLGPVDFVSEFKEVVTNSLINYNIDRNRHSQKYITEELAKQKKKKGSK